MLNRTERVALAEKTIQIFNEGMYQSPQAKLVNFNDALTQALENTITFKPDFNVQETLLKMRAEPYGETHIEVTHETSLEAAKRLWQQGKKNIYCLNFASAKNPGGGFLGGSQAQEESLARSSALYASLTKNMEMYEYNRTQKTMLYSDYMIYSPDVPVFRADDGMLLEDYYLVSFITSPAVNLGALKRNTPYEESLVAETFRKRLEKILAIAYQHQHKSLVLGAWGCGVFGNDPKQIAQLFYDFLGESSPYRHCFNHIVYAIYGKDEVFEPFNLLFNKVNK